MPPAFPASTTSTPRHARCGSRPAPSPATRQFQLTRLYAELAAADAIEREAAKRRCSSSHDRAPPRLSRARLLSRRRHRLSLRARSSPMPRRSATTSRHLRQAYHRELRAGGAPAGDAAPAGRAGHPLRLPPLRPRRAADQALPAAGPAAAEQRPRLSALGHLWRLPHARRAAAPGGAVLRRLALSVPRQRPVAAAAAASRDRAIHTSVMLACDVLQADRTVYGAGLDLGDPSLDVPVGPSCRLCPRRDCADRQEEALAARRRPVAHPRATGAARIRCWRIRRECALVCRLLEGRPGEQGGVWRSTYSLPRMSRAFSNRSTSSCAAPAGRSAPVTDGDAVLAAVRRARAAAAGARRDAAQALAASMC